MISQETIERISQVAETCIRCRRCMKECLMLSRFSENPKALFTQYLEKGPENMDRHIAYSCNECSQCTLKCPRHLNLKAVFQSLKADYAAEHDGIVPVEALLPSEQGQVLECDRSDCTTLTAGSGVTDSGPAKYLFVPGLFPWEPILDHLKDALGRDNVALFPHSLTTEPSEEILDQLRGASSQVLISACPSSYQILREKVSNHRVLFYWDLMQNIIGLPHRAGSQPADLQLHGTLASDSIRWALGQLGASWEEQEHPSTLENTDRDTREVLGLLFGSNPHTVRLSAF